MTPTRPPRRPSSVRLAAEPLEARDAPATLVNPTTVVYTDVGGDRVTVRTRKGTFDFASNFLFADTDPGPAVREQLQRISVTEAEFEGASLTVMAVRSAENGGDGFANVGHINANFRHLGTVSVDGDLGQIDAGGSAAGSVGLQSLVAQSMGRFDLSTQGSGGSLENTISGTLGSLIVRGDVANVSVSAAEIGRVRIGGSLIGTGLGTGLGYLKVAGAIGSVRIGGDLRGGGDSSAHILAGRLGPVTIGGSLIGGDGQSSGSIRAPSGNIGLVTVGGSLLGGTDQFTGSIVAFSGKVVGVSVGGSLIGGSGLDSASIYVQEGLGPVMIRGDVRGSPVIRSAVISSNASIASVTIGGSLIGGAQNAGTIAAGSTLGPVTVRGSVRGGSGQDSGGIFATTRMGLVRIAGDLLGGAGQGSGAVFSFGDIAGIAIGHSVIGGPGSHPQGQIHASGDMGPVSIGGDLRGGSGERSGMIQSNGSIASVAVGGSVVGRAQGSGFIAADALGPVTIGGNVLGGDLLSSGGIHAQIGIGFVRIGGDLVGGPSSFTGCIISLGRLAGVAVGGSVVGGSAFSPQGQIYAGGDMGPVTIGGELRGGGGFNTGTIHSEGALGAVRVGRDVNGGTSTDTGAIVAVTGPIASVTVGGSLIGGFFNRSGEIFTGGNLGLVSIGGDIRGGSALGLSSLDRSGYIQGKNISSFSIGGSIIGGLWDGPPGTLTKCGSVRADGRLGPVVVKGSLIGTSASPVYITAQGPTGTGTGRAISSLTVGGRVEFAQVLAGYSSDLVEQNGNARIGPVLIGHDWVASTIASGVLPVNGLFGDADDAPLGPGDDEIIARIASITIRGTALGTVGGSDHFGFVAQQIGSLTVGGTTYPLSLGAGNDLAGLGVGATGDLRVREVSV